MPPIVVIGLKNLVVLAGSAVSTMASNAVYVICPAVRLTPVTKTVPKPGITPLTATLEILGFACAASGGPDGLGRGWEGQSGADLILVDGQRVNCTAVAALVFSAVLLIAETGREAETSEDALPCMSKPRSQLIRRHLFAAFVSGT